MYTRAKQDSERVTKAASAPTLGYLETNKVECKCGTTPRNRNGGAVERDISKASLNTDARKNFHPPLSRFNVAVNPHRSLSSPPPPPKKKHSLTHSPPVLRISLENRVEHGSILFS